MEANVRQGRSRQHSENGAIGAGCVLALVDDPARFAMLRSVLNPTRWRLLQARGGVLPAEGVAPDVRALVVEGDSHLAIEALARFASRVSVVLVSDDYAPDLALDAVRRGAVDWLSADQLELLPSVLEREECHSASSANRRISAASRVSCRLLEPMTGGGRLDEYCEGVVRTLRAHAAMVLVADRGGELVAIGAAPTHRNGDPAGIGIARDKVEAVRTGKAAQASVAELGVFGRGHVIWSDLRTDGRVAGVQVVSRTGEPFDDPEIEVADKMAELASLRVQRAEAVSHLRRNDAIKTDFVRTVSHELRTPLNNVIGYSDLLVEGVFGPLDDEQRKILRRVGDRARGLLEVIAATLELPGVDAGRVALETRPISVAALLEELEVEAREWRVRDDLRYSWNVPDDLPTITTDAGKLRVLLKNLIANATKFTHHGGITVSAYARDNGVEFSVADTGIGIEVEAVHFVFDAFRQASAANARQYGGVGLGLYIVRRLAGMLGGRLRVESEVGVGSKFFVWVPTDAS